MTEELSDTRQAIAERSAAYNTIRTLLKANGLGGAVHFPDKDCIAEETADSPDKLVLDGGNKHKSGVRDVVGNISANVNAVAELLVKKGITAVVEPASKANDNTIRLTIAMDEGNRQALAALANRGRADSGEHPPEVTPPAGAPAIPRETPITTLVAEGPQRRGRTRTT